MLNLSLRPLFSTYLTEVNKLSMSCIKCNGKADQKRIGWKLLVCPVTNTLIYISGTKKTNNNE